MPIETVTLDPSFERTDDVFILGEIFVIHIICDTFYMYLSGSTFLCSVLIAPVRNEEGTAVMYIVNHEDVTWSPNKDDVASKGNIGHILYQG